jgi:hypothetical protein
VSENGPVYEHIEFCRNVKTLWSKLESGYWDWLGVHPKGQYVLGRPRRGGSGVYAPSIISTQPNAKEGQHGIRIQQWTGNPGTKAGGEWFTDATQAKAAFQERVNYYENPERGPILAKVTLVEKNTIVDERFIVPRPPSNYQ